MTSEITQINRAEALRYMGYTHEPDERISAVIAQWEQELLKEARKEYEIRTKEGYTCPIPADAVPVIPD